ERQVGSGKAQHLLGAAGHGLASGVHPRFMFGSRTGCSTLLTLQSAQLFGVLSDRRFGPLHLRSESLLFIGELAGVDAGCLRSFLGALRFSRQLVQLAGSTCCLAL